MKKYLGLFSIIVAGLIITLGQSTPLITSSTQPLGSAEGVAPGSTIMNFGLVAANHTLTRTNNTTAYTVNDYVGADERTNCLPASFTGVLPGGSGKIIKLRSITSSAAFTGTLRYWFYASTNITAQADNIAYTTYYTNAPSRLGYLDVILAGGTSSSYGMNIADQLPVINTSDANLYYNIQTLSGVTPTANMTIYSEITVQPNK